jgi:hypothetical protein
MRKLIANRRHQIVPAMIIFGMARYVGLYPFAVRFTTRLGST